jgi:hypothetical protein
MKKKGRQLTYMGLATLSSKIFFFYGGIHMSYFFAYRDFMQKVGLAARGLSEERREEL